MSHMSGAAILLKMRSEAAPTRRPADLEVSATIVRQMVRVVTKTFRKKYDSSIIPSSYMVVSSAVMHL